MNDSPELTIGLMSWLSKYTTPLDYYIYHYTTPDALLKILTVRDIILRFTRTDCVNDISEGNDIIKIYLAACNELLSEEKITFDFYQAIKQITPEPIECFNFNINGKSEHIPKKYTAYMCCFSMCGDLLPMWNYYSYNGRYQGYSIGFDAITLFSDKLDFTHENENDIHSPIINKNEGYIFEHFKVIYKDDEKKDIITKAILYIYQLKNKDDKNFSQIKSQLEIFLSQYQFVFKNSCFEHEREGRAVIFIPNEYPENATGVKNFNVEYTSKHGYIIPYIDVSFSKEKTVVSQVTIGPLLEKELSNKMVDLSLKSRGYTADAVNSSVPIRF